MTAIQKQLANTVYDYGAVVFENPASRPDGAGGIVNTQGEPTTTWGGQQPDAITHAIRDGSSHADESTIACTPELFALASSVSGGLATKKRKHSKKHKDKKKHRKKHRLLDQCRRE